MAHPTLLELEETAKAAVSSLKQIPEFGNSRIAIIGGTALWKLFPAARSTQDVDFLICVSGAPQAVKKKLLELPDSPYSELAQLFVYNHPRGEADPNRFYSRLATFVPEGAIEINAIDLAALPYITPKDLLALKINTCGLRPNLLKKTRDARDAMYLVDSLVQNGVVTLSEPQKAAARAGYQDVADNCARDADWWKAVLQL